VTRRNCVPNDDLRGKLRKIATCRGGTMIRKEAESNRMRLVTRARNTMVSTLAPSFYPQRGPHIGKDFHLPAKCQSAHCLVSLLPVPCNPDPATRTTYPVACHPNRGWPWPDYPTARHPDVVGSGPSPVASRPNVSRSRRHCLGFNANRWRRSGHQYLASWPRRGHFLRRRCSRHRCWFFRAANQC
jgi:hypothetical protein